jgi:type VI protein secretion system component Hcp
MMTMRKIAIRFVPLLIVAVTISEFTITKYIDKASPPLY